MTIVGFIRGFVVFCMVLILEEPPYRLAMSAGAAVFLIAFLSRDIRRRSIECGGHELVIRKG